MLFYQNKKKHEAGIIGVITNISGKKLTVKYNYNNKLRTNEVNYSGNKQLEKGEQIALYLRQCNGVVDVIELAKVNETLTISNKVVMYGEPYTKEAWLGFVTEDGLHEVSKVKGKYTKGDRILCIGSFTSERLSSKGQTILSYESIFDSIVNPLKEESEDSLKPTPLISIGCYAKKPILVSKMFEVTGQELQKVLAWASYVADEWNPDPSDSSLMDQKNAIKVALKQFLERTA